MVFKWIHVHHDGEEQSYFPWIQVHSELPPRLTKTHVSLVRMMDEIKSLAEERRGSNGPRLMKLWRAFSDDMRAHIAEEEVFIPEALRKSPYTEEDEGKLVADLMAAMDPEVLAFMLPPMAEAVTLTEDVGGLAGLTREVLFFNFVNSRVSSASCRPPCQKCCEPPGFPSTRASTRSAWLVVTPSRSVAFPFLFRVLFLLQAKKCSYFSRRCQ